MPYHLSVSAEGMKRPAWTASGNDRLCKLGGPTLPVRGQEQGFPSPSLFGTTLRTKLIDGETG